MNKEDLKNKIRSEIKKKCLCDVKSVEDLGYSFMLGHRYCAYCGSSIKKKIEEKNKKW